MSSSSETSWWVDIRNALRGTSYDFTSGSLGRAIVLLSIPMVLEMLMQSVFEVADIYFVGKLGADAVAAVGLTASLIILVFAVGLGLSMAASAMVARRVGEGDQRGAGVAAVQAFILCIGISLPIGVFGVIYAADLLRLMGATESVVDVGTTYCQIIFGGNLTILLLFLINAVFRGAGDAAVAMRALGIANLLNIILDPILIFGWGSIPAMGVTGAAVATTFARGIGVSYQLYVLATGRTRLYISRDCLRLDLPVTKRLLRVSSTGMLQYLIGTASWMGIMRLVAVFGSAALAGYTIAVRVIVFALLPSWGMGNAAATLVGQNLGAGKPERAERAVWITAFSNTAFLGVAGVLLIIWAEPIISIFTPDEAIIPYGVQCLRIVSYSFLFWAFGMVTVQAFNGAGDTVTPTWINLLCFWIIQIPLAYALALPLGVGSDGVFWGIAVAQTLLAFVAASVFRQGRWKTRVI